MAEPGRRPAAALPASSLVAAPAQPIARPGRPPFGVENGGGGGAGGLRPRLAGPRRAATGPICRFAPDEALAAARSTASTGALGAQPNRSRASTPLTRPGERARQVCGEAFRLVPAAVSTSGCRARVPSHPAGRSSAVLKRVIGVGESDSEPRQHDEAPSPAHRLARRRGDRPRGVASQPEMTRDVSEARPRARTLAHGCVRRVRAAPSSLVRGLAGAADGPDSARSDAVAALLGPKSTAKPAAAVGSTSASAPSDPRATCPSLQADRPVRLYRYGE
jgi:hypothetical protein